MKIFSTIVFIFVFTFSAYSQSKTTLGEDVNEKCSCPEFEYVSREYKLHDIEKSENDIEIRLRSMYNIKRGGITVITYKNKTWDANYYTFEFDPINRMEKQGQTSYVKYHLKNKNMDSTFFALTFHNAFTLPNQSDIYKGGFFGGNKVEYKLNNKTGDYTFDGPNEYIEKYPDVEEYKEYKAVLNLFYNLTAKLQEQIRFEAKSEAAKETSEKGADPNQALIDSMFGNGSNDSASDMKNQE